MIILKYCLPFTLATLTLETLESVVREGLCLTPEENLNNTLVVVIILVNIALAMLGDSVEMHF